MPDLPLVGKLVAVGGKAERTIRGNAQVVGDACAAHLYGVERGRIAAHGKPFADNHAVDVHVPRARRVVEFHRAASPAPPADDGIG